MKKLDFCEVQKKRALKYCSRQIPSCEDISLKKESIIEGCKYKQFQIELESNELKSRDIDSVYMDFQLNTSPFSMQPCIIRKEKHEANYPNFEITYDLNIPNITYQVSQSSKFYEEIYSKIYSQYSTVSCSSCSTTSSIKLCRSNLANCNEEDESYSLFWDNEPLYSTNPVLLGEISGLLRQKFEKEELYEMAIELPNISKNEVETILDYSYYCNEFAFLKHYQMAYPFEGYCFKPNVQLQWLFIEEWPHLVVMTIPGTKINQNDELFADLRLLNLGNSKSLPKQNIYNKLLTKDLPVRKLSDLCCVCKSEFDNQTDSKIAKCISCLCYIHEYCGYCHSHLEASYSCHPCLKKAFSTIFGLRKRKEAIILSNRESNEVNQSNFNIQGISNIFSGSLQACNSCYNIWNKKMKFTDKKISFLCRVMKNHFEKDTENTFDDTLDVFYAQSPTKNNMYDEYSEDIDLNLIENCYQIVKILLNMVNELKSNIDITKFCGNIATSSNYILNKGLNIEREKKIFSENIIFDTWRKSRWKDFIFWDYNMNGWVASLRSNGLQCFFPVFSVNSFISSFNDAELWLQNRLSETIIPGGILAAIEKNRTSSNFFLNNSSMLNSSPKARISPSSFHSPYLPTDLASHPDYQIQLSISQDCKFSDNIRREDDYSQLIDSTEELEARYKRVGDSTISNISQEVVSGEDRCVSTNFNQNVLSNFSMTSYNSKLCYSPINKKRRIRSTLPVTSNAAKCPTEWRVRGITWHAERKAFIVPYRRDKDGGLTSTTFGAMKYGSPLTAFLKALDFRENYLKEQAMKLSESIKLPHTISEQASLIRSLPDILWDSEKMVWKALTEDDTENQLQQENNSSSIIEVDAKYYGARIAYEIAEVYYVRHKALKLKTKEGQFNSGYNINTTRLKNRDIVGYDHSINGSIKTKFLTNRVSPHMLMSQNSFLDFVSKPVLNIQNIRLRIVYSTGEEEIRNDIIAWHSGANTWIILNRCDDSNEIETIDRSKLENICPLTGQGFSLAYLLIKILEACIDNIFPSSCRVYIHAEDAESIIESEDLANLLRPLPTGISWYYKKRRFYTSNGLDSNGRGQHFSIALYGSLISAFNAAIDYRNIFLKNRRKNTLPKVMWILCYPFNINLLTQDQRQESSTIMHKNKSRKINNKFESLRSSYSKISVSIDEHLSSDSCIPTNSFDNQNNWLQHPTTVSLLEDQLGSHQNDLDSQILNLDILN
ncbi:uncharacterized protein CMU_000420 [Cryptosporidium muris RN66]|uniref:Uncharacterized protein n=1 Tax=Cryptosporidium muris (strain RN66) TaxID=441375 RepID=B6AG31_CRYMR|nr:uncharacterized protein CMU_000420 [Cryptosporidium muris RN66]EEA07172.1 hypothetical protein, conserved [Cryptosporidium muris RN66]|eukprot:XP_002141521.1 hypothetical protein [Cryptosporidium muris RN66]